MGEGEGNSSFLLHGLQGCCQVDLCGHECYGEVARFLWATPKMWAWTWPAGQSISRRRLK